MARKPRRVVSSGIFAREREGGCRRVEQVARHKGIVTARKDSKVGHFSERRGLWRRLGKKDKREETRCGHVNSGARCLNTDQPKWSTRGYPFRREGSRGMRVSGPTSRHRRPRKHVTFNHHCSACCGIPCSTPSSPSKLSTTSGFVGGISYCVGTLGTPRELPTNLAFSAKNDTG